MRAVCLAILLIFSPTIYSQEIVDQPNVVAGQLLFLGISGKNLNSNNIKKIRTLKPGGIIFFGSNIRSLKQISKLITNINALYDSMDVPRPFIALDQEGGYVTRIKTNPLLPSPALLGFSENQKSTRDLSYFNSKLLRDLGFNMNFAPVLDIQSENGNDFLGSRSFSKVPLEVTNHGHRVVEGANEALVISTAKHFPGHGDVDVDSHKKLPVSQKGFKELNSKEIIPYIDLIKQNKLPAIMVGHISFPKIDPVGLPASFSKNIIHNFLRQKLGFKGLVMTDDIQMQGAKVSKDPGKRTLLALEAGVDIVMVAWNSKAQKRSHNAIVNKMKTSSSFRSLAIKKAKHILQLKNQYKILKKNRPEYFISNYNKSKLNLENSISQLFKDLNYDKVHTKYLESNANFRNSPLVVISKFKSFYRSFSSGNSQKRSLFFQLNSRFNVKRIRSIIRKYPSSPIYLQVSNRRHESIVKSLNNYEKSKVFIINSQTMRPIRAPWVIVSKTNLPNLGKFLLNNKKRAVANARP